MTSTYCTFIFYLNQGQFRFTKSGISSHTKRRAVIHEAEATRCATPSHSCCNYSSMRPNFASNSLAAVHDGQLQYFAPASLRLSCVSNMAAAA